MKFKKIIFIISLLFFINIILYSKGTERKIDYSIDIMGIGGAGIGANDKVGMIFLNPAASALPLKKVVTKKSSTPKIESITTNWEFSSSTMDNEDKSSLTDSERLDKLVDEVKEKRDSRKMIIITNYGEVSDGIITNVVNFWKFSLLNFGVTFNGFDIFNLVSPIIQNFSTISSDPLMILGVMPLDQLLLTRIALGLNGPIKFGYVGHGITAMLYNNVSLVTGFVPSFPLPNMILSSIGEAGLRLGYAMKIPLQKQWTDYLWKFKEIYAGFQIYSIYRVKTDLNNVSTFELMDSIMNIGSGGSLIYSGLTFGLDFGLISRAYDVGIGDLTVGLVLRDISPGFNWNYLVLSNGINQVDAQTNTYFGFAVDIGASYSIKLENYNIPEWLISAPVFYFDIRNIFDFSEYFFLKLRMGVEVTTLNFLKLRMGLYKGYPSIGIGIDLPITKFNAVYFVEELGAYPGSLPQQNIMVEFSMAIL